MEEVTESSVDHAAKPKKPFLRRGEGTARRVFASRYREEGRKKRQENQQRALQRQEGRKEERDPYAERFIDLKDPCVRTFVPQPPAGQLLEFADVCPRFDFDRAPSVEAAACAPVREVDGSCIVGSDAVLPGNEAEAVREREMAWLESQRRHEDQQWREAMELKEFEALEKQIVDEARNQLERAEASLREKRVTFHEPPCFAQESDLAVGDDVGRRVCGASAEERKKETRCQKGVQKLKTLSATRAVKGKGSVDMATARKTESGASAIKKGAKSRVPRRPSSSIPASKKGENDRGESLAFGESLAIDSSFLDRLIDQDYLPGEVNGKAAAEENLVTERLKLQALKDQFETEKRSWEEQLRHETSQFEALKAEEMKKIKRERRVLEQQSKALLKLPNKKERSEIESLEALLETERKEARSKEARHKLTVERLRQQIQQLKVDNQELQEEVKWHENQELAQQQSDPSPGGAVRGPGVDMAAQTDDQAQAQLLEGPVGADLPNGGSIQSLALDEGALENEQWPVRVENPFYTETAAQDSPTQQGHAPVAIPPTMQGAQPFLAADDARRFHEPLDPFAVQNVAAQPCFSYSHHPGTMPWSTSGSLHQAMPQTLGQYTLKHPTFEYSNPFAVTPQMAQPHGLFSYPSADLSEPNPSYGALRQMAPVEWPTSAYPAHERHSSRGFDGKADFRRETPHLPPFGSGGCPKRNGSGGLTAVPAPMLPTRATSQSVAFSSPYVAAPPPKETEMTKAQTAASPARHCRSSSRQTAIQERPSGVGVAVSTPRRCSAQEERGPRPTHLQTDVLREGCAVHNRSSKTAVRDRREEPRLAKFDNGTIKQTYPGGRVVVWFANADVKHVHPCGRVEYFYADLNTWQVTHSSQLDVFYFDIGQVEAHKPNGEKDIIFPDGTVRIVQPNGAEKEATMEDVTPELRLPKPTIPGNRPRTATRETPPNSTPL